MVGDLVLLFNSRLRLFPGKLKSKWTSPHLVTQLFPSGAVELETKEGVRFKVNGQRIEIYFGHAESANEAIEAYHLDEARVKIRRLLGGNPILIVLFLVMVAFSTNGF